MRDLPVLEHHSSCVSRVPIFRDLTPAQQDAVAALAHPASLPAGSLVHGAGEALGRLFVVHTGRVTLTHLAASGRSRLLRVAGPGEVVGEHSFLTGQRPDYHAEAAEESRLCVFEHADLAGLVASYPAIAVGMLRSLSGRLTESERRLALAGVDVPARVADYLLELPATDAAHPARVRLPLAKQDIASWLGTTPESLSRALARLARDGTIGVDGVHVDLLDPARLEELASS